MLSALIRKTRQVAEDPVLRQWLIGRALGKYPGEPPFVPHRPPYLGGLLPLRLQLPNPLTSFSELATSKPQSPITLPLPGEDVTLNAKLVANIPLRLNYPIDCHVRGEVVMPLELFKTKF